MCMVIREGKWKVFGFIDFDVTIMVAAVNSGCTISPCVAIVSGELYIIGMDGPETICPVEAFDQALKAG